MTTRMIRGGFLLAASALALVPQASFAMSDAEKADVKAVVREYLLENPEVLLEAMDALEAKRTVAETKAQSEAIAGVADDLKKTPAGTALGNPDGDVTVVEFFDYNCGYCKRALPDMEALIKSDPKLRVVLREIPVLGEQSVQASHVSLAFRHLAPDKYGQFHEKLLGLRGVADEDSAIGVAEDLGLDEAKLRDAMKLPEVQASIDENSRLSAILRINGTPTYVIGNEVVPGAVGREALATKIANVRNCGSASC